MTFLVGDKIKADGRPGGIRAAPFRAVSVPVRGGFVPHSAQGLFLQR